jgi:hypothetical protein
MIRCLSALVTLAALAGCSVNPVTGKSEITFVGEATEIEMGEQNYAPMQQSQGGEYDIDPELTKYVQGVGNKLAAVSDRPLPYEFVVLNNSVPNAWALPGGKIASWNRRLNWPRYSVTKLSTRPPAIPLARWSAACSCRASSWRPPSQPATVTTVASRSAERTLRDNC